MVDTDKKKGSIYINGHENLMLCLTIIGSVIDGSTSIFHVCCKFKGVDMKRVDTDLKMDETDILAVFHDEIIFRAKTNSGFFG